MIVRRNDASSMWSEHSSLGVDYLLGVLFVTEILRRCRYEETLVFLHLQILTKNLKNMIFDVENLLI
ncbi:hypothetical protein Hanom_Chr12g01118671 [Helianthus anomalus]